MEEESFTCHECDAEFIISYEENINDVTHCPFCAATLGNEDEDDEELEDE